MATEPEPSPTLDAYLVMHGRNIELRPGHVLRVYETRLGVRTVHIHTPTKEVDLKITPEYANVEIRRFTERA